MVSLKQINTINGLLHSGQLEPYVRYIRFPRYKNLVDDTKVELGFAITALVGANGTNKSSVLRAIQGAPGNANLGNYWFSTKVDPIEETGDRPNCFIYGYNHEGAKQQVEVLKTRVRKQNDPDYWEPSRPIVKYGMQPYDKAAKGNSNKTRWDTLKKSAVYIDFRQSLSAFDKYFYHSENKKNFTAKEKKDFIRTRAGPLRRAIMQNAQNYPYRKNERVHGENRSLSNEEVTAVSHILGREYSEIRWIRHSFFNSDSFTCMMKMGGLSYTEAFAGSGEFAVVRLVRDVFAANKASLILLDEPEVSLHPGAQERLMDFLAKQVIENKHQIVISTHSPAIIRGLPAEAIKVFVLDPITGRVRLPSQAAAPEEAFFYLGEPQGEKTTIVVEDELAKSLVLKAARLGGEAFVKRLEVKFFPGGSATLWGQYVPIFAAEDRNDVIVLFDGDQRPAEDLPDPDHVPAAQEGLIIQALKRVAKTDIKLSVDGGAGGGNQEQLVAARRALTKWARARVRYLPGDANPEQFVWQHMAPDEASAAIDAGLDPKKRFEELTRAELGRANYEAVSSQEILGTQNRRLAKISDTLPSIQELYDLLKSMV